MPGDHSILYHQGVMRCAGVVHVGLPIVRARHYRDDARGYVRGGNLAIVHGLEDLASRVRGHLEHERRSWVRAVECLLEWVNGSRDLGGAP